MSDIKEEVEYPLAQTDFKFVKEKKKKDFGTVCQRFGSDRLKRVGRIMNRKFDKAKNKNLSSLKKKKKREQNGFVHH